MSVFDDLQKQTFDTVANLFADVATWLPSTGGPLQTTKVFFNKPSEVRKYETEDSFWQNSYSAEYREGIFTGLKALADAQTEEIMTVLGIDYYVRAVKTKFDGKTLVAYLEPKP